MMFKPMFALHRDANGDVLAASTFRDKWQLDPWLKGLDVRAGDMIEFKQVADRPEFDEVDPPAPAFIAEVEPPAPPLAAADDLTF